MCVEKGGGGGRRRRLVEAGIDERASTSSLAGRLVVYRSSELNKSKLRCL